jgi:hypothetical protein
MNMDQKTPRVYNRKVGGSSPAFQGGDTGDSEKNERGSMIMEASSGGRAARGSGWFGFRTNDKRQQSHVARDVVDKLQQEVSRKPSYRRASPMARMTDDEIKQEAIIREGNVRYKFANEPKSDADIIKKEKQRKWKEKMKIAQEQKRKERKALDEGSETSQSDDFGGIAIIACVLDNVEQTKFFRQFTRCGASLPDEDSALSSSENSGSSSEEETPNGPKARQHIRSMGLERSRHSVSSTESENETPATTGVTKDMNKLSIKEDTKKSISEKPAASSEGKLQAHHSTPVQGASTEVVEGADASSAANSENAGPGFGASSTRIPFTMTSSRFSTSTMTTRPCTPTKRSFIKVFVDDLTNTGEKMLWHKETSAMNPATVTVYILRGYKSLDGTFRAPRLLWTDDEKKLKYGVDLFDIRSLRKADTLELENFPFAMPGRTLCLHLMNGGCFIFEAATEEDAFRFVRGIRWVVARLAFNLVIGNLDVSCELLDVGLVENATSPRSVLMEFDWSRAMDDVTDDLVEKALSSTMI